MKTKHFNFSLLRYQLIILSFYLMNFVCYAQLEFRGVSPSQIAHPFEFTYTSNTQYLDAWGGDIEAPGFSLEGSLALIQSDSTGCINYIDNITDKIAFIYRGECTFFEKIYAAQEHGAKGVVIVNNVEEPLFFMTGGPTDYLVNIPAILISQQDGAELRSAIETSEVQVMLRNMQDFYSYNLSVEKEYSLIPYEAATPHLTIDDNHPYGITLGTFVFNRGSSNILNANLTATISLEDSILYEETTVDYIDSDDTLFFELPNFICGDLKVGKYKLSYSSSIEGYIDEDPFSDTVELYFEITDDTYSLVQLNENQQPIANHYTSASGQDLVSINQCIKYENGNASKIAIEGVYFSVQDEYESLSNQEILVSCYTWNNTYNQDAIDLKSNFTNLSLIDEVYTFIDGDYQKENLFVPFNDFIQLENHTKYLFCVSPTSNPDMLIGYNNELDYSLNNFAYNESIHPVQIKTEMNQQINWYNGFSSGVTPSIALKTIDANTLNISNVTEFNGSIFPNPVKDQLTISLETPESVAQINVVDITGKTLIKKEVNLNNGTYSLNFQNLENGMYIVNIQLKNGQSTVFNIIKTN